MNDRFRPRPIHRLLLALMLLAPAVVRPSMAPVLAADGPGVQEVTGSVTVTSPLIGRAFTETFILLVDLTAFVKRDLLKPLPSSVQVTGNIEGDLRDAATFVVGLPPRPHGEVNDLDGAGPSTGVQVYAVDFQVNLIGDPFLDPIEMSGWPTALSSIKVEIGTNEVEGGRVLVWSPDEAQRFPTGFGSDGKLFTGDDPLASIEAGWTVVDLNAEPFARLRDATVDVPIIEGDIGLKDLSHLTFTAAFDALLDELAARYPYTVEKRLDWDALRAEFRPRVEAAEATNDAAAFNVALMQFANAIGDGHVAVDPPDDFVIDNYAGSLGLAVGLTDEGDLVVRCVERRGAADKARIEPGAIIRSWDRLPPTEALAAVPQLQSESTPAGLEAQRLALLPRRPAGDRVEVAFVNPGGEEQTATLRAAREPATILRPCGLQLSPPAELPVVVEVLPSGIGYVKVSSFTEDLTLVLHAWEWALRELRRLEVPALIVDLRYNRGGYSEAPLYMAGSFVDEPFRLAEQVFSAEDGSRIVAAIETVEPAPVRWRKPVAVLVGDDCVSACELLAAALARDPAVPIVGMEPTAGVEAGVFPWLLPGDLAFRAPLIGFRDASGAVFLEGSGVAPTVRVPKTAESLRLGPEAPDAVRAAAEAALQAVLVGEAPQPDAGATPVPVPQRVGASPAEPTRPDRTVDSRSYALR